MSERSVEKDAGLRLAQSEVRCIRKGPCSCAPTSRRMLVWIGSHIYCSTCGPDAYWLNGPSDA